VRVLFISGTASGGAAISTRALADRLAARGHTVGVLVRTRRNDVGLRSTGRLASAQEIPRRAQRAMERLLVRRPRRPVPASHGVLWSSRHLESVASRVIDDFVPEVIVVNSVHARAWAALRRDAQRSATPIVLYVREENAVGHIERGHIPDLVVANAHAHERAIARHGVSAVVVPSIVDVAHVRGPTTRSKVLCVNPIPSRGLSTAIEVARLRPDLRFVFQESHRLYRGDRRVLSRMLRGIDNVTFRSSTTDQASVYRDAAVLLLPYLVDNRPRVVLEAHANGIPVVATDLPGLDECVGDAGVLVGADAPAAAWVDALALVLDDRDRYQGFVDAARRHAAREEVDPAVLTDRFEAALAPLVDGRRATA
jgi:glycosyltransferase involved in cell wall biosynthesis